MIGLTRPAPSGLTGLMSDARHLRSALRENAHDAHLTKSEGIEFVYLLDRPVFSIFAEPDSYGLALTAFPSFYEPDAEFDEIDRTGLADGENPVDRSGRPLVAEEYQPSQGILFVNALLASEYLFKEKATFHNQILVSPEHARELHLFAVSLTRRLEASTIDLGGNVEAVYEQLRRWLILQLTRRSEKSDAQLLESIREGIVGQLGSLDSPMVALHRLDRIYESNMLRHAAEALRFDTELISPAPELIFQWRIRISQAKRGNLRQPNPHAIEADAITLAQLELLNRDWWDSKRLCVLVSNDRGLHRAWSAWQREPHSEGRLRVNAMRDPRQLLPILDVDSAADRDRHGVVARVERALDQLLSSIATNDARPSWNRPGQSAWQAGRDIAFTMERHLSGNEPGSHTFREILHKQINEVAASWLELLEYSIVDRADLVASFAAAEAATWSQSLGNALKRQSKNLADDVAGKFFTLATSSALLRTEVWALAERAQPMSANRRRLVTEFSSFESKGALFSGRTLQQVVDDLKDDVGGSIEQLQVAEPGERLLVIGCMCLGIGAWAAARSLLEVASKHEAGLALKREALFFSCVARRLAADQGDFRSQYQAIERDLRDLLSSATRELDRLRVLNELAALLLCSIPFTSIKKPSDSSEVLKRSTKIWRDIVRATGDELLKAQKSLTMQALQKQFALNTFCLSYYQFQIKGEISDSLNDYVCALLNLIKRRRKGFEWLKEGVHGGIYPLMAQLAIAKGEVRLRLSKRIIRVANDALKTDNVAGFRFDIPTVDKIELMIVRDAMEQFLTPKPHRQLGRVRSLASRK